MSPRITGTQINYYHVCKRKLWLFSHQLEMEHESDTVQQGKLIDEESYPREHHSIDIDGVIVLDFANLRDGVLHEIKKSDAVEEAHLWQVKYYLYYLSQLGLSGITGEIDYPKLKRRESVTLTDADKLSLEDQLQAIERLIASATLPEKIEKRFCKTCAYYDLCWS